MLLQSLKRLSANFCFPDLAIASAGSDCSQFLLFRIDDFPKNVKVTRVESGLWAHLRSIFVVSEERRV